MTNYELHYSKFLADLSEKVADFIQKTYISGNIIYDKKVEEENKTENFDNISDFENVDNNKVEFVDYNNPTSNNKTLLFIIGAIILYSLLRGK